MTTARYLKVSKNWTKFHQKLGRKMSKWFGQVKHWCKNYRDRERCKYLAHLLLSHETASYWARSPHAAWGTWARAPGACANFAILFIHGGCSDKSGTLFLSLLSHANVDRFSNFFHQVIRKKILYVHIIKIYNSPAICCYTTLWKSKIQKCYWLWQHLNRVLTYSCEHFEDLI